MKDARNGFEISVDNACDMVLTAYNASSDQSAEALLDIVEGMAYPVYVATLLDALNVGGFAEAGEALEMWLEEQI